MKKLFLIFNLFLVSCISLYLESGSEYLDLKGINNEIKLLNSEEVKNSSFGYGFGGGFYKPGKVFLRLLFQQNKFISDNRLNRFYIQTGILDGGVNLLNSDILGIYPIVGIGTSFQELILEGKSYRNYVYPVIKGGFEFNINLTREMPGIFTLYLRMEGIYSSGYFLDRPLFSDFIISNPLKGINFSLGFSMGYYKED